MNSSRADASLARYPRRDRVVDLADLLDGDDAAILDADSDDVAFFWHDATSDRSMLAAGAVHHFVGDGPGDLARVANEARAALAEVEGGGRGGFAVLGGFAFADQPPGRCAPLPGCWFLVPRRLWRRENGTTRLVELDAPTADPPALGGATAFEPGDDWETTVASALERIRAGSLAKVVLSRGRRLPRPAASLRRLLRHLRATRPGCATFALRCGTTAFFGSTPEWIVRVDASGLHAPALAGTHARGLSAEADEARAAALLACLKNRREHRAVVDGIVASLARLGIQPEVDDTRILRLPEAMHLRTGISARVPAGVDVLRLASELHPTPATCGAPRAAAAEFLRRHEGDRGWYTGGIGWMDARGRGDVVVGLRSALRDGEGLTVRAGAGIVSGSDARSEFVETELKMEAMLEPLRALAVESDR